ncbi:MAG: dihydroorotase, partial [Steroidobacteraceae bacterium]
MSDFDLVIAGRIVLPARLIEDGYVAVRGGRIAAVGSGAAPAARERHLLGKAYVLPG